MLSVFAFVFLTILGIVSAEVDRIALRHYIGFAGESISNSISSVFKSRNLQEGSVCDVIADASLDLGFNATCTCSEEGLLVEYKCVADDVCVQHSEKSTPSFTGGVEVSIGGDFSDNTVDIAICFTYDGADKACVTWSLLDDTCRLTSGDNACTACTICDMDSSISFDCFGFSMDQCNGDSLMGSPMEFYSSDLVLCNDDESAAATPEAEAVSACTEVEDSMVLANPPFQGYNCTCLDTESSFQITCLT